MLYLPNIDFKTSNILGSDYHQDAGVGEPSLQPPTKVNNQTDNHKQKNSSESSGVHLRIFSNIVEQRNLKITTGKGRKNKVILPASPHPPGWHCSAPRAHFQLERVPLTGKNRVGWTTRLSGHHVKDPPRFHPTQRPAQLRCMEMPRNKEKEQGLPKRATQWE